MVGHEEPFDLRSERIRQGLTRPAFAAKVGVGYDVIRRAEKGLGIREDSAKLIADYLGIDPVRLVDPAPREAAA